VEADSWLISQGTSKWTTQPTNLERAVPGHLIILSDHHVGIIQAILPAADGQPRTRRQFLILQSTSGVNHTWLVETNDFWQNGTTDDPPSDIWYPNGYEFEARRLTVSP